MSSLPQLQPGARHATGNPAAVNKRAGPGLAALPCGCALRLLQGPARDDAAALDTVLWCRCLRVTAAALTWKKGNCAALGQASLHHWLRGAGHTVAPFPGPQQPQTYFPLTARPPPQVPRGQSTHFSSQRTALPAGSQQQPTHRPWTWCRFDPEVTEVAALRRLLTFGSRFVRSLHLQQLPSHLDLQILFDCMHRQAVRHSGGPDAAGKSAQRQPAADNQCWSLQYQASNCGMLPQAGLTMHCSCSKTVLSTCLWWHLAACTCRQALLFEAHPVSPTTPRLSAQPASAGLSRVPLSKFIAVVFRLYQFPLRCLRLCCWCLSPT